MVKCENLLLLLKLHNFSFIFLPFNLNIFKNNHLKRMFLEIIFFDELINLLKLL